MEPSPHHSGDLKLKLDNMETPSGADVLSAILDLGTAAISRLRQTTTSPMAVGAYLRGTGPGISFGRLVDRLDTDHPRTLKGPFEGSDCVSGAAWLGSDILSVSDDRALAKLRWKANATDLPMHTHEYSDRVIIVLEGRGFFHVSNQLAHEYDGTSVKTIAARERDVFVFTQGCVHTFSTSEYPMTLLSVHLPWVPFESYQQYELVNDSNQRSSEADVRPPPAVQMAGWYELSPETGG